MNQALKTLSTLGFALVFMTGVALAQDNESTVTQVGDGLTAEVDQKHNSANADAINAATVDQTGNYHSATISQVNRGQWSSQNGQNGANGGRGNYAKITQTGNVGGAAADANTALIDQSKGRNNQAYLSQDGLRNDAKIYQPAGGFAGGATGATAEQIGDDNELLIDQTRSFNDAGATQTGNGNTGEILQNARNNRAFFSQTGDLNDAFITQETGRNTVRLSQTDDLNYASITQETGKDNVVKLDQSVGATATILQSGTGNVVKGIGTDVVASSLGGSTLMLDQLGDGNVLQLDQTNGGVATVTQDGTSNTAAVVQN